LDIEKWTELQRERLTLGREIGRIKEDYEGSRGEKENGEGEGSQEGEKLDSSSDSR
jgi:hypothetical protein